MRSRVVAGERTNGKCGNGLVKGRTGNVETGSEEMWKRRNEPWDYRVLDMCSPGTVSDYLSACR